MRSNGSGWPRSTISGAGLIVDHPACGGSSDPTAVNLVADVISFPPFLRALGRQKDFVAFAFDRLQRRARIPREIQLHAQCRSEASASTSWHRRAAGRKTVLIDEGVVLSAYQLFVYSDAPFRPSLDL